jgi:hypothetical protein
LSNITKVSSIDVITSPIKTQNYGSPLHIKLKQHDQRPNHSPSIPPIVLLLPLTLSLPLPLTVGYLPQHTKLVVSFAAPLVLALGKNNANKLGRIKFQQEKFVAKSEFN